MDKVCLFSESFFTLAQISKKRCQITLLRISSTYVDSPQESDLAPLLGDLIQSKKLSEIKPPLALGLFFKISHMEVVLDEKLLKT